MRFCQGQSLRVLKGLSHCPYVEAGGFQNPRLMHVWIYLKKAVKIEKRKQIHVIGTEAHT